MTRREIPLRKSEEMTQKMCQYAIFAIVSWCCACGEPATEEAVVEDVTSAEAALRVQAQGPLVWSSESLFLLDADAAMSWLFRLEQRQEVRFTIKGFGGAQTLRTRVSRWSADGTRWEEAAWVEARSDRDQAVVIARTLEPGYYWLLVSGEPGASAPTPYALLAECEGEGCASNEVAFTPMPQPITSSPIIEADQDAVGLTQDMRDWLKQSRFAEMNLERADLEGGSYGGRQPGDALKPGRDPVIFIHGNSDRAVGGELGGWQRSIEAFREAGWGTGELYATTWGPASISSAAMQYHSRESVEHVRAFIEAVLEYTGAERVDIVTHSMGVTLARRAILGGVASDALAGGDYAVGEPLTERVDTFVGIAGANRGLVACALTGPSTPTCGATNGLYPGTYLGRGARSQLLRALDAREGFEGEHVFTIWSPEDELINTIGQGSLVWGEVTSRIAGQEGELVVEGGTHLGSRDETVAAQVRMVSAHRVE
jgi:triacylglycerol lipase